MEKKIKTAREFLIEYNKLGKLDFEGDEYSRTLNDEQVLNSMIEFAKMHIEQALKTAQFKKDPEHIINCYPESNIK